MMLSILLPLLVIYSGRTVFAYTKKFQTYPTQVGLPAVEDDNVRLLGFGSPGCTGDKYYVYDIPEDDCNSYYVPKEVTGNPPGPNRDNYIGVSVLVQYGAKYNFNSELVFCPHHDPDQDTTRCSLFENAGQQNNVCVGNGGTFSDYQDDILSAYVRGEPLSPQCPTGPIRRL